MKAQHCIDAWTACGQVAFTVKEFCQTSGMSYSSAINALARLRHKKEIVALAQGYYLILTPEFRQQGCLPPDYFIDQFMRHLNRSYYVGLLSAAMYYRAFSQQPHALQIMIEGELPRITCGSVHLEFIQKRNVAQTPTVSFKTRTGYMKISTPEATARDLVHYMRRCGGLGQVMTILDELAEEIWFYA